jgi:tetratricopeptide (TPR) repeat protein
MAIFGAAWRGSRLRLWCMAACQALVLAAVPGLARADWVEVSSDHFVLYGDQRPDELRKFAERLEMFHGAMSLVFKRDLPRPSPSNRVAVYVVTSTQQVRELTDINNRFVNGIYVQAAGNSFALVPRLSDLKSRDGHSSDMTLYHEYAHHFMHTMTSHAYPRWFTEGFAEFFSTARFTDDQIAIGAPAKHRSNDFIYAQHVPIRDLLEYDGGATVKDRRYDSFYARAWALFHYLVFAPERAGQLPRYEYLLGQGIPALEAAEQAFGDLPKLDDAMEKYLLRTTLRYLPVDKKDLEIGEINVRVLPPAEAAIMPVKLRSRTGVTPEEAAKVVVDARRVAALYQNDAAVLAALAEAEFDAGNDDAAIAAADRALAIDPKQMNAWVQKGWALEHKVQSGALPVEAWKDVRTHWARANKVENNHPIPLKGYYSAFLGQGLAPTPNAVKGLEWALALAPYDGSLRWAVAQQMIHDKRLAEAAYTLRPLAYSPHPGEGSERARTLLGELEAKLATEDGEEPEEEAEVTTAGTE